MQRLCHHLMVLLRLGWLTVLSSMNIVEHELNFLVKVPGETCKTGDHLGRITPDILPTMLLESTFKSLRDLCNCFSFSLELQCKEETS